MVQSYTPTIGCDIVTADGEKLGEVKEVQGNYFKVDASMAPDYWLPSRDIVDIEGTHVRLAFLKAYLDEHKHDEPGRI